MSENLIYGADILSYGAVADGKTDCADAFTKAIENGENLISVPYGRYVIKKALKLVSNLKIHLHPGAEIIFGTKAKCCMTADGCSSVILEGGRWICEDGGKTLLSAANSNGIRVNGCAISCSNGFAFKNCEDVSIRNTVFDVDMDCLCFRGEVEDIYMKNVSAYSCVNFIDIDEGAEVEDLFIYNINISSCAHLLGIYEGELEGAKICGIYGDFTQSLIYTSKQAKLSDFDIEEAEIFCSSSAEARAYFDLSGHLDGIEICDFERKSDSEALPFIPTLLFEASSESSAAVDGITLDNVIAARGKSKTVAMTTARLTNPTNKFIYTLECTVPAGDVLTIPLGDFNTLTIYEN